MAPPAYLRAGEEDWKDVFDRLCERFQNFGPERVSQVLRDNGGHAGQAASALRDLSGTAMRPVDPDDAEHVRTLLSSPVMFSHACKEHFRKFDINGDGCLEWSEIVQLTNSLYDNFGLQAPREGGLRAFFEATDTNHDGVLSEKEFKRFFEMFLRYAFFDVVNHKQQEKEAARPESAHSERRAKEPKSSPQRGDRDRDRDRRREERDRDRDRRRSAGGAQDDATPVRENNYSAGAAGGVALCNYRCVAPNGVAFREKPDYNNQLDSVIQQGQSVQVQEVWIKTPYGWLPVTSEQGEINFEPTAPGSVSKERSSGSKQRRSASTGALSAADASPPARSPAARSPSAASPQADLAPSPPAEGSRRKSGEEGEGRRREKAPSASPSRAPPPAADAGGGGGLRPGEEEWQGLFERLSQRFPGASPDDVAQALRDHAGHAGQAATKLRQLTGTSS